MAEIMDLYIIRTPYIWRLIFVKKVRVIFEVLRYIHTYFICSKMTWQIKTMHKQVQSKPYKAQGALTVALTTNRQTQLKQSQY